MTNFPSDAALGCRRWWGCKWWCRFWWMWQWFRLWNEAIIDRTLVSHIHHPALCYSYGFMTQIVSLPHQTAALSFSLLSPRTFVSHAGSSGDDGLLPSALPSAHSVPVCVTPQSLRAIHIYSLTTDWAWFPPKRNEPTNERFWSFYSSGNLTWFYFFSITCVHHVLARDP